MWSVGCYGCPIRCRSAATDYRLGLCRRRPLWQSRAPSENLALDTQTKRLRQLSYLFPARLPPLGAGAAGAAADGSAQRSITKRDFAKAASIASADASATLQTGDRGWVMRAMPRARGPPPRVSEYKRRQAPIGIRVTPRGFGRDWRYPVTNRFREDIGC